MLYKKPNCESLNQNTCPVLDAEEIKKQEQKEKAKKLGCKGIHNMGYLWMPCTILV